MSDRVVTNYSIIEAGDPRSVVEAMQSAIAEKWEPIGGIATTVDFDGERIYTQALVQRELVDEVGTKQDTTAPKEKMRPECRACPMNDTCPKPDPGWRKLI